MVSICWALTIRRSTAGRLIKYPHIRWLIPIAARNGSNNVPAAPTQRACRYPDGPPPNRAVMTVIPNGKRATSPATEPRRNTASRTAADAMVTISLAIVKRGVRIDHHQRSSCGRGFNSQRASGKCQLIRVSCCSIKTTGLCEE